MFRAFVFAALLGVIPLGAAQAEDVPLAPFGLPFTPFSLRAVPVGHPLHRNVQLAPILDAPDQISWFFVQVVNAKEIDASLRETLDRTEMLAHPGTSPEYRLAVRWLGLDAPLRVSIHSEATAKMRWSVTRVSDGAEMFSSDVETSYEAGGGDAARRRRATARFALLTNIASGISCIDRSATALQPDDCVLTPQAHLVMPRLPIIIFNSR